MPQINLGHTRYFASHVFFLLPYIYSRFKLLKFKSFNIYQNVMKYSNLKSSNYIANYILIFNLKYMLLLSALTTNIASTLVYVTTHIDPHKLQVWTT